MKERNRLQQAIAAVQLAVEVNRSVEVRFSLTSNVNVVLVARRQALPDQHLKQGYSWKSSEDGASRRRDTAKLPSMASGMDGS